MQHGNGKNALHNGIAGQEMNAPNYTHAQFISWHEEVDMPFETDAGWVDLVTGISFAQTLRAPTTAQRRAAKLAEMTKKHGSAIAAAEEAAKERGWAPLTGTAPQKAWAAQIRAKLIPQLAPTAEALATQIKPSQFWIENRDMSIHKLDALIMSMRIQLETAAAVRKEAAVKAKATRIARKVNADKISRRNAIILELLDTAAVIPSVPAILGEKVLEQDGLRVFIDSSTKLVTFLIRSAERKETLQTKLDVDREVRMIAAMS